MNWQLIMRPEVPGEHGHSTKAQHTPPARTHGGVGSTSLPSPLLALCQVQRDINCLGKLSLVHGVTGQHVGDVPKAAHGSWGARGEGRVGRGAELS